MAWAHLCAVGDSVCRRAALECVSAYRRWCQLQVGTPRTRWRSRSLRSRRGGSLRHRAAKGTRHRRQRWGAERRWWQPLRGPWCLRLLPRLRPRFQCQRWSHCRSWRCLGNSDCPAGCASQSPPSDWPPGCCCGGRMLAMVEHRPLL